jgi:hypothetical protein
MNIGLKRRSFPARIIKSYKGWRKYLGVVASVRAAWSVATA